MLTYIVIMRLSHGTHSNLQLLKGRINNEVLIVFGVWHIKVFSG